MTMLEKKMDILIRVVCAEDNESKQEAMKELRDMRKNECAVATPMPERTDETNTETKIRDCAEGILIEIGVPSNIKGYDVLIEAICLCVQDKTYIADITKRLYPDVGNRIGTTPSRVERAMRHAIEVAFVRCDMDVIKRYFGNSISPVKGKPSNSEFISRMANVVFNRLYK